MQIVICAATQMELNGLQQYFKGYKTNHDIIFLIHGIGLGISSAYISKYMCLYPNALFVQVGLAGHFNHNSLLGQVYLIGTDCVGDMGVMENQTWKNMEEMELLKMQPEPFATTINYTCKWAEKYASLLNIPIANAITVNQITTTPFFINYYLSKNIAIETMEGAALAINGLLHNCRYLQIRAISNYVGERNKANWDFDNALKNLTDKTIALINTI